MADEQNPMATPEAHSAGETTARGAGGVLGAVAGAVAGTALGALGGPLGMVAGAVAGGVLGAAAGGGTVRRLDRNAARYEAGTAERPRSD